MKKSLFSLFLFACCASVYSQVVANFSGTPTLACIGQTVQFTDLSTGGPTTWLWTFPGASPATSTLQNPAVTYSAAGMYNVILVANNGNVPSTITKTNYITVIGLPSPGSVNGSTAVCAGQNAIYSISSLSNATSYSWTVPSGASIITGQGTNSISVNFGTSSGNICITASNSCGTSTASCLSVTVNALPVITINTTGTTICAGSSTTLTASGANSYTWSPSTGLSSTTGSSVVASPTINTTYNVIGTTTNGCTGSASVTIHVNPNPTITITPSTPSICTGGSVTLVASGAGSYTWSPSTGLSATTGATVIASPSVTTTYTCTGTSSLGCIASATVTVTVSTAPPATPGSIVGSTNPCAGQPVNYFILPVANAITYSWTVPLGATISAQGSNSASVIFGSTPGNLCVTAINACGSSAASCLSITPISQPTVIVSPSSPTICSGSSVTLTASGAITYSFSPGTGLSATTGSMVIASPTITTTYSVIGTATTGCTNTTVVTVNVRPAPVITIIPNTPNICTGGSVTLVASGANTYTWSPATALNTTNGATVIASPTITTTYTAAGTSTSGCQGSAMVTVSVSSVPPVSPGPIMGPSLTCAGQATTYSVLPVLNTSTYSWTVPSGVAILSGQGTTSISVVSALSATGAICVTASNACGTSSSSCQSVTFSALPAVTANPSSTTICAGNSVTLSAGGASTYSWSPSSGLSSAIGSSVVASPSVSTIYSVTGTSTTGCKNTAVANVIITLIPTITIVPNAPSICNSGSVTLTASGASTYSWSPSTGLNTTSGATVIANPTITTTYTVVGTSGSGCTGYGAVTVTVTNSPPATPSPVMGSANSCVGQTGSYSVTPVTNASGYIWTVPSGASVTAGQGTNIVNVQFGTTGGNVCVTATNACGTSAASCLSVTLNTPPIVSVTPSSSTVCAGSSVTLTASGATTYSWSPAAGLSSTFGTIVIATPVNTTTYIVTGTALSGCSGTAAAVINIGPSPTINIVPNAPSVCLGGSVTLTASGANTYTWSPPSGLNTTSGPTVIASPVTTTNYTVTGNSSSLTCNGYAVVTVSVSSVSPASPVQVLGNSIGCSGQVSTYSVLPVVAATGYSWTVPNGLVIVSGQGTNTISVLSLISTSGNVCATATNACGNSATSRISVTVNATPSVSVSPLYSSICSGSSQTLTAIGANNYSWTPAISLNTTVGQTVIASPGVTTNYTVTGTTNGCSDKDYAVVTVLGAAPLAPTDVTGPSLSCSGQSGIIFSATRKPDDYFYNWTLPSGYVIISGQGTSYITAISGTTSGNVCVTAGNNCGISPASCFSVTVNASPSVNAVLNPATCGGNSANNNASIQLTNFNSSERVDLVAGAVYTGTASYSTAAAIPVSGIITNTLSNPATAMPYTIRIFNSSNCSKDTTVILSPVNCENGFFIPDAFTPDGDGKNDQFVITGLPSGIDNTFTVYNRWGSKVYSKSNYDNSWNGYPNVNGTLGTDKLLQGTYYYILEFKGGNLKNKNGFIALEY